MNWIIKFNISEKECIDKVLDIVAKYDDYKNELLDKIYTEAYKIKPIINNLVDKLNSNTITQEHYDKSVKEVNIIADNMVEEYKVAIPKIQKCFQKCVEEMQIIKTSMYDNVSEHLRNKKEFLLMRKRTDLCSRKIANIVFSFNVADFDEFGMLDEVKEDILMIQELIKRKNKEYNEKQKAIMDKLKESQKIDYSKIFDYKEMISLAEKNEYTKVRQTGDHIIMQHAKTNKIVPIPAHELKYGLMLQIQKQIHNNKIVNKR